MGLRRWVPAIIAAPVLALSVGIALLAANHFPAVVGQFVDEGPGEQYIYPVVYTPRFDTLSAPEQSRIVLDQDGEATIFNVLVGTISKNDDGRPCLSTSQVVSGKATWRAENGVVYIDSEEGRAVLISEVERMSTDWGFTHQLSCDGLHLVYNSLSEPR